MPDIIEATGHHLALVGTEGEHYLSCEIRHGRARICLPMNYDHSGRLIAFRYPFLVSSW